MMECGASLKKREEAVEMYLYLYKTNTDRNMLKMCLIST